MTTIQYIIPSQKGAAFKLKVGQCLKVIDPLGEQVADLFCADEESLEDTLSGGRTIDYNESIYIKPGHFLYSQSGKKLLCVSSDTSPGKHDLLVTPCSLQMFQMIKKNTEYHPSCLENLYSNLKQFGIKETQITSTLNIFMNISLSPEGRLKILPPTSKAQDHIIFKAQRNLIVGLTACSDEQTNNGRCKPIHYEIY